MLTQEIAEKISDASALDRHIIIDQCITLLREEHADDLPSLFNEARKVNDILKNINFSISPFWLDRVLPTLLQDDASFAETSMIVAATGGSLPNPAWETVQSWGSEWATSYLSSKKLLTPSVVLDSFSIGTASSVPAYFIPWFYGLYRKS